MLKNFKINSKNEQLHINNQIKYNGPDPDRFFGISETRSTMTRLTEVRFPKKPAFLRNFRIQQKVFKNADFVLVNLISLISKNLT